MITLRYPLVPAGDDEPFLPPEKDFPDVVHQFQDAQLALPQRGPPPGFVAADLGDGDRRDKESAAVKALGDTGPGSRVFWIDPEPGVRRQIARLNVVRRLWRDLFCWDPEEWRQ